MIDLNFMGKLKEFRTRCGQHGMAIHYEHDLAVPYAKVTHTGNTSIHLPYPDPEWTADQWIDWEYKAEHELGHLMPKCIDAYDVLKEKKIAPNSFLGSMLNLAEDNRQEWMDYYELEGRRTRLNEGRNLFLKGQDATKLGKADDDHMLAFQSMYTWDTLIRESWMPALIGQADRMLDHMTPQQMTWIEKLSAGDYESTLKSGLTAPELYDLVKRIIDEVFEFDADEEEKQAQEQQAKAEEGEDGEGEGEAADGEGGGEAGDVKEGEAKGDASGTIKYSDLLAHQHDEDNHDGDEDNTTYSSLHIEYDVVGKDFEPRDPNDYILLDYPAGFADGDMRGQSSHYYKRMTDHAGDGLAKHVRRLLQVRSASSYQHGMKRGKISPKSIYRAGNIGHPMERKVFKKKITNNILNTAVFVLCDMSGSMGGDKLTNAGISCKLLNEAIGAINIPLEIAGFDDHYRKVQHSLWKSFAKAVTSDELVKRICDSSSRMMSGNSDGESILWAYNRLMSRREKRKILIVLSDGSPAGHGGDCMHYTQEVVKTIEKTGAAEIYGIGIEDRNVKLIYKENETIQRAAELEAALLKVIKDKILN